MVDTKGLVTLGMPSNAIPTMGELNKYLIKYCEMWKSIGLKLGLEDDVITVIQSNHPMQIEECFREALQKWLKQDPKPTWSTLELAITNARRDELGLENLLEVPIQKPNGRSKEDGNKRQERTSTTSDTLSVNFSSVVMTIKKILENCKDKLEACKELCSNLTISGNSDVLLFSDEQLAEINQCTSFQQLFTILRKHWNWEEYSILKGIIAESGSKEAKEELHKFEKFMGSYHSMKLISDKHLSNISPEDYAKLYLIIEQPYKDLTPEDFKELRTFIFQHLDIKEYTALPFGKFIFRSLHLEWYVPVQAVSHIVKMIRKNKKVLIEKSIVLIKVGDKNILDVKSKISQSDTTKLNKPAGAQVSSFPISKEHSHVVCPSCKKLLKNPKYLPCYHSYCEECLEKMQKQSKITCLKCKTEVIVPDRGVKDLSNNYFIVNLVNKLMLRYKIKNENELRCEECDEDDPVIVFCTDCKLFLCHFCKKSHKYSKSHCSHNLISLTELRSNKDLIQSMSKFPTCQEHDLELEYYCETCEKLMCVQCSGEHKGYQCDAIAVKKIADKYQDELKKVTVSLELIIKDLSKLHNSIEQERRKIKQQADEINKEIDIYYNEVIEKLLVQKEQVKQQVRDTMLQKEKAVTEQMEEMMDTEEDILNLKRIRDAIQENSIQEVISATDQIFCSSVRLMKRFKQLGYEPIESANIQVIAGNKPLPQVVTHFATIDSLSFEVKDFDGYAQQGLMATLEIITKDSRGGNYPKGGCEVNAIVEAETGEKITAEIVDNTDGTYSIHFIAEQTGKVKLSVFVNGREIRESPLRIMVQDIYVESSGIIIAKNDDNFGQLHGIACSKNGMWAVADLTKNCIHVFDSQNKLIKRFGNRGKKTGEFICPFDIAFDDNNELYVTDRYNDRVQKFDHHGNYLLQFGDEGAGEGQLNCPAGITTHRDKVYVADRENHRISVFQKDGKFYGIIGQQELSKCFDIAVNMNGEILAVDWKHHCIHIFTLNGYAVKMTLHKETGSVELKHPCSITTDSNGFILITDTNSHCISIFDRLGNCIVDNINVECNNEIKFPRGIAVGHNSNIYVVGNSENDKVGIFPPYV